MSHKNGITHKCLIQGCPNPVYIRPCEPNKKYCSPECKAKAPRKKRGTYSKTKAPKPNCLQCGEQCPRAGSKYCGKECSAASRVGKPGKLQPKTGTTRKCLQCPNPVYIPPYLENSKDCPKYCSRECTDAAHTGIVKERIGKTIKCLNCPDPVYVSPCLEGKKKFCSRECTNEFQTLHKKPTRKQEMSHSGYRKWRKDVLARDNHTCVLCKATDCKLEIDHIIPWSVSVELRYDVTNGRTLCVPCHKDTDTYGSKAKKYPKVVEIR